MCGFSLRFLISVVDSVFWMFFGVKLLIGFSVEMQVLSMLVVLVGSFLRVFLLQEILLWNRNLIILGMLFSSCMCFCMRGVVWKVSMSCLWVGLLNRLVVVRQGIVCLVKFFMLSIWMWLLLIDFVFFWLKCVGLGLMFLMLNVVMNLLSENMLWFGLIDQLSSVRQFSSFLWMKLCLWCRNRLVCGLCLESFLVLVFFSMSGMCVKWGMNVVIFVLIKVVQSES